MSFCSVIMVIKNSAESMFAALESVLMQSGLAELIIIDNGNAPDILSRLNQRTLSDPCVKIITGQGDVGFANGCNLGAREAVSDVLLFLKPDYFLPPDALRALVDALENEPKAMITSGFIGLADGSSGYEFHNQIPTPKSVLKDIIGLKKRKIKASENPQKPFTVATVSNACICVRASDYKKLGGLDEKFYEQEDDADFCLRVQQIEGRIVCVPSVKIIRIPRSGIVAQRTKKLIIQHWHIAQNNMRYLNKFFAEHLPFGSLFLLNSLIIFHALLNMLVAFIKPKKATPKTAAEKRFINLLIGLSDAPRSEKLVKKIVLVTGANSAIGICVIRQLLASGAAVLAVTRGSEIPYQHPHLRWLHGDLADANFSLQGYCMDAVVHAAPLPLLPPLISLFADGEAKRIIVYGSTSVFSNIMSNNHFERDFASKLQAAEELFVKNCEYFGIAHTIFRPTISYGLGLDRGISKIAKIIRRFGFTLVYPPAFGRRQPVHADDLANAAMLALANENTYGKSYNLSGGEILTYREMLAKIFAIYGKNPRIFSSTMLPFILDIIGKIQKNKNLNGEIARRMNDDFVFFHDDAKNDFSFQPRSFLSAGIKDIEGF